MRLSRRCQSTADQGIACWSRRESTRRESGTPVQATPRRQRVSPPLPRGRTVEAKITSRVDVCARFQCCQATAYLRGFVARELAADMRGGNRDWVTAGRSRMDSSQFMTAGDALDSSLGEHRVSRWNHTARMPEISACQVHQGRVMDRLSDRCRSQRRRQTRLARREAPHVGPERCGRKQVRSASPTSSCRR